MLWSDEPTIIGVLKQHAINISVNELPDWALFISYIALKEYNEECINNNNSFFYSAFLILKVALHV